MRFNPYAFFARIGDDAVLKAKRQKRSYNNYLQVNLTLAGKDFVNRRGRREKSRSSPVWESVELQLSANRRSPEKPNMLGSVGRCLPNQRPRL